MRPEQEIIEVRDLIKKERDDLERQLGQIDPKNSFVSGLLGRRWEEARQRQTMLDWVLEQDSSARLDDEISSLRCRAQLKGDNKSE